MLDGRYKRGFSPERLAASREPKVRNDEMGYYIMSLSENTKVYFEDFYRFLELTYVKAAAEREILARKLRQTEPSHTETLSYYRARGVVIDLLMRTIV
ncbi:MAG: hypothetical protein AB1744_04900, partial [Candidatus Zixiibacteriota bacterium]